MDLPAARIGADGIFVGDVKLPDPVLKPRVNCEYGGVNELTVTFVVSAVDVAGEDSYPESSSAE